MRTKLVHFVITNWYSIVWIISCLFSLTGSYRTAGSPDCHAVKDIVIDHAAKRRYNDTKFNSTAEIDCEDGYYNPRQNQTPATSTTIIRCSEQGTWINIPNCIRKDCGSLEMLDVSNAANKLILTDTKYGSNAAVTCKTGYYDKSKVQMKGVSTTLIKCSENGTWVEVPNCVRKNCGNLTDIPITNADHRRLHTDTKFKSIADIDCDDGYYIKGRIQTAGISTQQITCSDTGTWINVPECVPKDCGRLNKLNLSNAENRNPINGTTIYTSLANISCDEGYKELNKSQVLGITYTVVRCNENGTWANLPKCIRKDCGPVNQFNPTNLNLESAKLHDDTKFNSTADVVCDIGYYNEHDTQTAGLSTTTITCSKNGNWMNLPSCVPKDCGKLEKISLTNVNERNYMNGTVFTSIANMSCDVGFKDKDEVQTEDISTRIITCSETGNWTNLPTCIRKDCGNVIYLNISNAYKRRQMNGTEYKSTAEIDCDAGFHNKDVNQTSAISTTTITCSDRGTWMNIPTCVPKDCGQLPLTSNGKLRYVSKMTTFASKAVYICDNGYQINGSDIIECKDTGKWSDYTTYCQIKDCGLVSPPANGDIVFHRKSTVYGSKATYICNEGYNMIGQANITCEASGNWDNKTTYCEIKDCGMPKNTQDGFVSAPNGTKFEAIVEFKCNPGYTLHGDNTTTCMQDGKWKKYTVNCTQNKCEKAKNIKYGSVDTTFEGRAIYECNIGYTLNGSHTLFCQLDGTWESEPPTCNVSDCGPLQNPTNGKVNTDNGTEYKSVATYSCNTGYTLIGDNMTSCEPSRNWSLHSLNCTINNCGPLTQPINGSAHISNGTTYQSLIRFACDIGFKMNGTNTSVCLANSTWSHVVPKCTIKDCKEPNEATNGRTVKVNNGTKYKDKLYYSCNTGYDLKGKEFAVCQEDATWSVGPPNCIIKDCGNPNETIHGTIFKTGTKYKDNVTYSCHSGYETTDAVFATCNSRGNWSRPAPVCKDINECARYTNDCDLPAICSNTEGSYTCKCPDGFTDNSKNGLKGRDCQDIDECADWNKSQCNKKGSQCVNYHGGYVCVCHRGWTGTRCENDINECNDTSSCGVEAYCTNFDGGYNCTCNKDFPKGDPAFHCYVSDCGSLEMLNISNAANKLIFTDTKYGSNAGVTCITGYYDKNKAQMKGVSSTLIKCSENGTWVNVPNCVRKDCGNLTDIPITYAVNRRLHTNTKFESTADIDCDDGYYIKGRIQTAGKSTQTITCSDTGTWINVPECVPKDCGRLDQLNLSNAKDRNLINGTTIYTSLANISCDEGYKELNSSQILGITYTVVRCNENGTWANLPQCVRKDCGDVQNIKIEHAANRTLLNGDTKYNDTADITCDLGYYDTDQKQTTGVSKRTILCSYTGQWRNIPKCIPKDCGNVAYLNIRNANNRRENNGTEYESTAEVDCDAGFHNKDITQTSAISTTTIKCSDRGTWIDIPTCVPKDCGLLIPPNDGFVVTLNGTKFGASSEFRCNPGYTLFGDYFTTCLSNGTWQNYHVNCILNKKAVPTICFSCDGMSSPEYCDKVEHCQPNQICYTESYQTDYGKVFRSGCMDEQKCHKEENSTTNSVCVECCTSEMCNNKGCGNADFPPREHRGPMCFDCQHIGDINSCRKVTMCASDQVCSIEKQQWGDTYHYKLGCTHHLCNSLLHQNSGTGSSCHACCSDDYCNKNCTLSSSTPGEIFVG